MASTTREGGNLAVKIEWPFVTALCTAWRHDREREKERDKNSFKVGKYTRAHRGKRTIGYSSHNVEKLQLCETTIDIVHVGERIEHGTPNRLLFDFSPRAALEGAGKNKE